MRKLLVILAMLLFGGIAWFFQRGGESDSAEADLVVAGSLTKALCVPGIRLGYLCAGEGTIRALEARMRSLSSSSLICRSFSI